jgi:molecular chaperone GrpE
MTEQKDDEAQQTTQDDGASEGVDDEGVDIPVNGPDASTPASEAEEDEAVASGDDPDSDLDQDEQPDASEPDFDARETAQETPTVGTTAPDADDGADDAPQDEPAEGELDDLYLDPDEEGAEVVDETPEDLDEVGADESPPSDNDADSSESESVDRQQLVDRIDELEERVEQVTQERDEMEDRMYRAAADLENFRKRAKREKEELEKYGAKDIILEMLPAIDNLERALQHAKEDREPQADADQDGERDKNIVDGVDMTLRQLHTALEKHGIEVFDAVGDKFDPELHEAMQQVETDEQPPGTVVEQFQRGYTIKDRLLRPALVAVAKQPADEASEQTGQQADDDSEADDTAQAAAEAMQPAEDASNENAERDDDSSEADSEQASAEDENATTE